MRIFSSRVLAIKLSILGGAAIGVAVLFLCHTPATQKISASANGPSASHTGAPGEDNCASCHSNFDVNSGSGAIAITGIPAIWRNGQQYPLTVTASQEDAVIYGFQLTAIDDTGTRIGTFTLPVEANPRSKVISGIVAGNQRLYVEHTESGLFLPMTFGYNNWTFTWNAPANGRGRVRFFVAGNSANSDASTNGDYIYTRSYTSVSPPPFFDLDGDRKTDVSIYRPSLGQWWHSRSSDGGNRALTFGTSTDTIVPADFTGDGKSDIAFFRPSTGFWFVLRSEDNSFFATPFGTNGDVPVPTDFDADGKADIAVFRPSNSTWYINKTTGGTTIQQFGIAGDVPVAADYDGDAKADIAIYRPNAVGGGQWWIQRSATNVVAALQFGTSTDKTVVGDYTGDGKADIAFWRPSTGFWNILRSEDLSYFAFPFGTTGDVPVPGDYDGDGKFDAGVFRPSNSTWYVQRSTAGTLIQQFGITGDLPLPNAYVR